MPLYDCMLLLKPKVHQELVMDLVKRIGKHVYRKNGVITGMKSFGQVQLGYGIKKLDGRYYQGQMMQMTMMTPPSFNKELQYLNKEDRLLRWVLIKHRDVKFGLEILNEEDVGGELGAYRNNALENDNIDDDDEDDDGNGEYAGEQSETSED